MTDEEIEKRSYEYSNIEEAREIMKKKFNFIVDEMLDNFIKVYKPFYFKEIKEVLDIVIERVDEFCEIQRNELKKIMDFKVNKKYPIEDKRCLNYEFLEEHFNIKDKNNSLVRNSPILDNFLNIQRLVIDFSEEQIKEMNEDMSLFSFKRITQTFEESQNEFIYLMKKDLKKNKVYAFTSDDNIYLLNSKLETEKKIKNIFGKPVDMSFYKDTILIGSQNGNVYFTDENLDIKKRFNVSKSLISVFLKNDNEAFYSFQGGNTLYFNTDTYLGWKKDFFNMEMMNYIQDSNLAFLFTNNKFFEISTFENKKFFPRFKMKCSLFSKLIR